MIVAPATGRPIRVLWTAYEGRGSAHGAIDLLHDDGAILRRLAVVLRDVLPGRWLIRFSDAVDPATREALVRALPDTGFYFASIVEIAPAVGAGAPQGEAADRLGSDRGGVAASGAEGSPGGEPRGAQ